MLLNSATQGGGIHAVGGRLRVSGSNNQPASVSSNLLGGGIEGQAVNFSARNASISGNIGDGVRLFFSSYLIDRSDDCHAVDRCSRISSNTRRGITATLSQGAVLQTFVEDNGGSGVQVLSGSFTISNSVVADNNVLFDESAILVATGSANILQSTVVGADRAQPLIVAANAQVESRNSILWRRNDSGSTVFPIRGTGDIELECGIVDSISNPPSSVSGIRVFEQDPRFQSLNDDNFHLSEDSPAIDRCEVLQPRERDIDREERGFDVPGAGGFFTDDIGADEFQGIAEAEATG